jgi:hypothetical protein
MNNAFSSESFDLVSPSASSAAVSSVFKVQTFSLDNALSWWHGMGW